MRIKLGLLFSKNMLKNIATLNEKYINIKLLNKNSRKVLLSLYNICFSSNLYKKSYMCKMNGEDNQEFLKYQV